jgi:hypothetical protein
MSVKWTPSSKAAPVAEYRSYIAWLESNRYKEIIEAQKDKLKYE